MHAADGHKNDGTGRPYLAVCAIYRDEAAHMREWIEFHRLVGVRRFFLYNNRSNDQHREILAPYVQQGVVELSEWPLFPGQLQAYDDCLERHANDVRWIAFLDLDEFLFSPTGRQVPEILLDYEEWPGVGVNRLNFGPSGHETRPPGLLIENYLRRTTNPIVNMPIKCIVDPTRATACATPHMFRYESKYAVDENLEPIHGGAREPVSFSRLRINHYARSLEEFKIKLAKPTADLGALREVPLKLLRGKPILDDETDETILMYVSPLREALAKAD